MMSPPLDASKDVEKDVQQLIAAFDEHDSCRVVYCTVCGMTWEENWVGVALVSEAKLGPICPACISRSPAETASRLRFASQFLQQRIAQVHQTAPLGAFVDDASLRARGDDRGDLAVSNGVSLRQAIEHARQLHQQASAMTSGLRAAMAGNKGLRESARRIRTYLDVQAIEKCGPAELRTTLSDTIDQAALMLSAADLLPLDAQWSITIDEMISRERQCWERRLFGLGKGDLPLVIDKRYTDYLLATI